MAYKNASVSVLLGERPFMHRDLCAGQRSAPGSGKLLRASNTVSFYIMKVHTPIHQHQIIEWHNHQDVYYSVIGKRKGFTLAHCVLCARLSAQRCFAPRACFGDGPQGWGQQNWIINLAHPRKSGPYGHVSVPSSFSSNRAWELQQVIWKSVWCWSLVRSVVPVHWLRSDGCLSGKEGGGCKGCRGAPHHILWSASTPLGISHLLMLGIR